MVRPEVVRKRLNKLDEYLTILSRLQRYTLAEFLENPERYGSAERFLHLSIEAVTDIGSHIIADDNLGSVDWYSDIPGLLAEHGIISEKLREKWIQMIGFQNTLVHEYIEIDRSLVYEILQHGLDDQQTLKRVFAQYL